MKILLIYLVFFLLFCISIFFRTAPCLTAGEVTDGKVTGGEVGSATSSATEKEHWGDQPSSSQSSQQREDWDAELDEEQTIAVPSYRTVRLAVPSYRTVKFQRWAVRCPACGARPGHCPCS